MFADGKERQEGFAGQTVVYIWRAMEPLIQLTHEAAAQNDRWLFIAGLVVLGCFAVATMRYFVLQHERLIADHKLAREEYQSSLRRIVAEQNAANAKLMVCLDNNSRVLEECRDELRTCREERRDAR